MSTYVVRPTTYISGGGTTPSSTATVLSYLGDNSDTTTVQHTTNSPVSWKFGLGAPSITSGEFVARVGGFIRWKDGGSGIDPTVTYIGAAVYRSTDSVPAGIPSLSTDGRTTFITSEPGYSLVSWSVADCNSLRMVWYDGKNNSGSPAVTTAEVGANIYTIAIGTSTPSNVTSTQSYPVIPVAVAATIDWEASTYDWEKLRTVTTEVRIESGGTGVGTGTLISSTTVDTIFTATGTTNINVNMPTAITNGTYKIYARSIRYRDRTITTVSADQYGAWSSAFTLTQNVATPLVPVITGATWDSTLQRTVVTVSDNMIGNPSFDTNASGWAGNNCAVARVTTPVQSGAGALSLTSSAAGQIYAINTAHYSGTPALAAGGLAYTLSAYVRSAAVSRNASVGIEWYDSAGTYISTSTGSAVASSTSAWTRVSVTATAPVNAYRYALDVYFAGTAAAGEVHYVDSVQFELGSAPTPYRETGVYSTGAQTWDLQRSDDGGVTWSAVRGATAGNSTAASAVPAGWLVYDYESPRNVRNLLPNPNFDNGTTYWNSGSTLSRVTSPTQSGSGALQVSAAGAGAVYVNAVAVGYLIPITAGATYVFSTYTRAGSVSRNNSVNVNWYTSDGTFISGSSGIGVASSTTAWTRISISAAAPANAAYANPFFAISSVAAAGEIHYFDSPQFEQASAVSTFDPYGVQYRARSSSTAAGITYTSAWSTVRNATVTADVWNLKVPENAALNDVDVNVIGQPGEEMTEDMGVFRGLDRRYPVVVAGTLGGWDGTLQIATASEAEWQTLKAVLECQKVLLLESPFGWSKYIRIVSGASVTSAGTPSAPRRYVSVSYVQTQAP